jgi:two-component system, sensor histidine kinase and response regulator
MIDKQLVFLVVDDYEPMRKVTILQLRAMGVGTVLSAANGSEALRILQNRRVDFVISDLNMPLLSGLELLKAVRADQKLAHLPFIMITAESERIHVEEIISNGVSDLLIKPYTGESLSRHVDKMLSWHSTKNLRNSASPTAKQATPAFTKNTRGTARPTILVVDDSADNLMLLSSIFKQHYRVRIANSGEKALEICQSNSPPDLVLLDIMMPGMDGFEVARRMREHPTSETIPVIFVTAETGEDERHKCLELGAVDFVSKPVDPDMIRLRVQNFMRYVELHKDLQVNYDNMLELARLRESVEHIARHDMKGPLAGVIGMVQALTYDNTLNSEQIRQLHKAENTAFEVLDMINLSSELFKIETGRYKLDAKPIKVGSMLQRIAEILRTTFINKHLVLEIDTDVAAEGGDLKAMGDATLCYSMFQNLIKNACEAAPELSQVSITLHDEVPLHILIQNTGAVPAEIRGRFFDKFVTLGKQGGTGLGTYSAKALAVAQNGNVDMEVSDRENQTTIIVTLPRYTEAVA